MPSKTVLDILTQSTAFFKQKGLPSPRLDAEVLLAHALGKTRVGLYTAFDQTIAEPELNKARDCVRRRARHEPVAYITGEKEFYSRAFHVTPQVLIPRPETEVLVEQVDRLFTGRGGVSPPKLTGAETAPLHKGGGRILDLGTGSGALAITLACLHPDSPVDAVDLSTDALAIAQENAKRHGCAERISFHALDMGNQSTLTKLVPGHSDGWPGETLSAAAGLPNAGGTREDERVPSDRTRHNKSLARYDLIVSNPPYLSEKEYAETSLDIRQYEPKAALTAPEEGLHFYRVFFEALPTLLNAHGIFAAEIGASQRLPIQSLFSSILREKGFGITFYKDYAGLDRGVILCPSAI